MGYRYRLHVSKLPGKPDLVFPRLKRIIEVRGCVDSHVPKSRIEYWRTKLTTNRQRDRETVKKLRAAGWNVLTIWETEPDLLSERIKAFLSADPLPLVS